MVLCSFLRLLLPLTKPCQHTLWCGAGGTSWPMDHPDQGVKPAGVKCGKVYRGRPSESSLLAPSPFKMEGRQMVLIFPFNFLIEGLVLDRLGTSLLPSSLLFKTLQYQGYGKAFQWCQWRKRTLFGSSTKKKRRKSLHKADWRDRHSRHLLLLLRSGLSFIHLIYKHYVVQQPGDWTSLKFKTFVFFCFILVLKSVSVVIFLLKHWEIHPSAALPWLKKWQNVLQTLFPLKKSRQTEYKGSFTFKYWIAGKVTSMWKVEVIMEIVL